MIFKKRTCLINCYTILLCSTLAIHAQSDITQPSLWRGEWYVSWGFNLDYWSNSDIHVVQGSLNNNFTVHDVIAGDEPGWTNGLGHGLTGAQYNIRVGHFFGVNRVWGLELNFDHTKYNTNLNQVAHVTGVIDGQPINSNQVLTSDYFSYNLHNGANELMLNIVGRRAILGDINATPSLAGLVKIGAGVMLPHASNTILGNKNNVGPKAWGNLLGWNHGWWQVGGWTAGVETGVRWVIYKMLYFEVTDKEAYASLSEIPVYEGRASQNVWLNEVIFSLGLTFNRQPGLN
jgi:hypothetical protein